MPAHRRSRQPPLRTHVETNLSAAEAPGAAAVLVEKSLPLCCVYGDGKHGGRKSCNPLGELMKPSRGVAIEYRGKRSVGGRGNEFQHGVTRLARNCIKPPKLKQHIKITYRLNEGLFYLQFSSFLPRFYPPRVQVKKQYLGV